MGEASDHMLIYLNANTWADQTDGLKVDIESAQLLGVHLQLCHEFPSAIDPGSGRGALDFKDIIESTPPRLKSGPANVYKQIAISLKSGDWRKVGLTNLAKALANRVPRARNVMVLPATSRQ